MILLTLCHKHLPYHPPFTNFLYHPPFTNLIYHHPLLNSSITHPLLISSITHPLLISSITHPLLISPTTVPGADLSFLNPGCRAPPEQTHLHCLRPGCSGFLGALLYGRDCYRCASAETPGLWCFGPG